MEREPDEEPSVIPQEFPVSPEVFRRMEELEAAWKRRGDNLAQVIQNLSADRRKLMERLERVEEVVGMVEGIIGSPTPEYEKHPENYARILNALNNALAERLGD